MTSTTAAEPRQMAIPEMQLIRRYSFPRSVLAIATSARVEVGQALGLSLESAGIDPAPYVQFRERTLNPVDEMALLCAAAFGERRLRCGEGIDWRTDNLSKEEQETLTWIQERCGISDNLVECAACKCAELIELRWSKIVSRAMQYAAGSSGNF